MSTKIVLINGKKRSGKDYNAILIKQELESRGYSVSILSFAEPIKTIIAETFGITVEQVELYKNEPSEYGLEIRAYPDNQPSCVIEYVGMRDILQRFGTEAMKPIFGDDVWASLLYKRAEKSGSDFVLVPDFRFIIEDNINAIKVNVFNNDIESTDTHASETELNDFTFDYYIDNTGQPDLTEQIKEITDKLIKG